MINMDTLNKLEELGFGADVDKLESYVASLQDAAGYGNPLVNDSTYDMYYKLLKELKPTSEVLHRNWEIDDNDYEQYDSMLKTYGMCGIDTISDFDELDNFRDMLEDIGNPVEIFASVKENGHGVRAVYVNGKLYSGTTRGRHKKGRNITKHVKSVLPNYIEDWKDIQVVEIRGEMLVSIDNFNKYLKTKLKTPLSSVTSLLRDSVAENEIKLLDMVCYKILSSDDRIHFNTLFEEFRYLEQHGFKVPQYAGITGVTHLNVKNSVKKVLNYFEGLMDKHEIRYSCDGIVFAINDNDLFYKLGKSGENWRGNFALKTGKYWQQNIYTSTIEDIQFINGKSYITPKALIDPVITANGSTVSTVPLYNVGVMERYGLVPGATIYFRYGGEQGVTLCDIYGDSVRVLI